MTRQRITTNTVGLASVVVTPFATLVVALVAVGSTRRRQNEQLRAEQDRLELRQQHEIDLKRIELDEERRSRDREGLRTFLDETATRFETTYDAINEHILALNFPDERPEDNAEYRKWIDNFTKLSENAIDQIGQCQMAGRQLDLRLPFEDAINVAVRQMADLLHAAHDAAPLLPPISEDQEERCSTNLGRAMRTFRIFALVVQERLAIDIGDSSMTATPSTHVEELLYSAATDSLDDG